MKRFHDIQKKIKSYIISIQNLNLWTIQACRQVIKRRVKEKIVSRGPAQQDLHWVVLELCTINLRALKFKYKYIQICTHIIVV